MAAADRVSAAAHEFLKSSFVARRDEWQKALWRDAAASGPPEAAAFKGAVAVLIAAREAAVNAQNAVNAAKTADENLISRATSLAAKATEEATAAAEEEAAALEDMATAVGHAERASRCAEDAHESAKALVTMLKSKRHVTSAREAAKASENLSKYAVAAAKKAEEVARDSARAAELRGAETKYLDDFVKSTQNIADIKAWETALVSRPRSLCSALSDCFLRRPTRRISTSS